MSHRPVNAIVYDIEIINAIHTKKEPLIEGIHYCRGWHDHANMGISVIGAYDYIEDRYRVFCQDNFGEFKSLLALRKCHVTFNGLSFDNKVIAACIPGLVNHGDQPCDYDILVELWAAAGLGPNFAFQTHAGFSLDAVCRENFTQTKTGNGALAPIWWQQGKVGSVIDYCLQDVKLTKACFDLIMDRKGLADPRGRGSFLVMRPPVV